MPRRLLILGSTGSIGTQALALLEGSQEFEVVGLSANAAWEPLVAQAQALGVGRIALANEHAAALAQEAWTGGEVLGGPDGLARLVLEADADLVLNALVGSAGLGPTIATLGQGVDLALANKESLVVGGELVTLLANECGATIWPVDSEHAALHQLLAGREVDEVESLVLTASGGPFRGRTQDDLRDVGVEDALAHPTWAMGGKITIDSATMMNKGLEVIEAHHLFGTRYEDIEVVVHPQSLVHALVRLVDGAMLAHVGHPDMKVPIAYALHEGRADELASRRLDLADVGTLHFEAPDEQTFRCLRLAREAGRAGGTAPCVLNAANEVAVHAFLQGRLPFLGIGEVVEETLDALGAHTVHAFDNLLAVDREARDVAADAASDRAAAA